MNAERRSGGLPPGYPAQYEQKVRLGDGRRVLIRPILPSDAPELAGAIRTADPDTLRRRFVGGPPRLSAALLEHLTVVDYVHRFALVAIDPVTGRGVAIARYEPAGPGTAEIAVAVTPAWRCAGLATVLILLLAKAAAERGIHTFTLHTWLGTGPSPLWFSRLAGWAPRSSSRESPSSPFPSISSHRQRARKTRSQAGNPGQARGGSRLRVCDRPRAGVKRYWPRVNAGKRMPPMG